MISRSGRRTRPARIRPSSTETPAITTSAVNEPTSSRWFCCACGLSQWLLRTTPAAGFAVRQTLAEYPQVIAHYAPSAGYFPLPWWAGFAVLCAYTALLLGLALHRLPRSDGRPGRPVDWR
ncbi:hypothetical protein [Streptomyces sp. NPDC059708]|uniref:hypothetical protein n=1 Tax=Streptomyces sp. NPDC059708 TaxID=3346916 RepID=UPI0036879C90